MHHHHHILTTATRPTVVAPFVIPTLGSIRHKHEYAPRFKNLRKAQRGRITVRTGGSTRGSTVEFGQWGLRLIGEGVRLFDKQLKAADGAASQLIRKAAPGSQLYRRFLLSTPVTRKGVNIRMGKGKGDIENMATRWPVGKVVFEVGGQMHDQVVKEAFKRASRRLPGRWEIIKKGDLPIVGTQEVPEPAPKDYLKEMAENPTKRFQALEDSKKEEFVKYRRR